jgi:PAS domain S-box-containing protein
MKRADLPPLEEHRLEILASYAVLDTAHRQAEDVLLKAGALQRAIFNSANFSSIATDANGVIQIFNVGAERMLGYTAAEVLNKITPADISDPQEVIARAKALSVELSTPITPGFEALVFKASRGIEDIYELTYIRKDGSRFPAVVSVTALRDAQNAIIGYLLIGTDNTARKQAEEALLKAGALQSAIFNSANFSSIATDANGVIQIFNVGAERMLGYTAAEVLNKITPADISDPQEVIARAKALSVELSTPITPGFEALVFKASRGIEDIYELTYIRKDGSRFPAVVSVTALRDAQNAIIGYLLIGTDNTERKQVEAEQKKLDQRLRDQQFYTRSLIESNIDALMTTDPAGIITDVNKQMEELTGCTRDELIGAPFKDHFTDPQRAEAGIKLVLHEKHVTNYELTARARDGKTTVVSYNATTFYDRNRTLQGVFAAARDITERKHIEHILQEKNVELEQQNRRVEEANRLKSEFLANMSHELRTPLNAIIGFADLMHAERVGPVSDNHKEFLGDILTSARHLLQLINDILDLSKVEAGKMEFMPETVNLTRTIAEVCEILGTMSAGKSIKIDTFVDPSVGEITLDLAKLKQILYNYLSNALKFTPDQGRIKVSALPAGADHFRIQVEDSGIGIKLEDVPRLFVDFQQLDVGASKKYPGTGLGLSLTKKLAEAQGGRVGVTSTPGEGSTFFAILPKGH